MQADLAGILVMMAARASVCARAMEDLFAQATRPERVFFHVASPTLDSKFSGASIFRRGGKRVRWLSFDPAPGRGLLWARAHARSLELPPVAFGLQIAPHLRMIRGWDELLLEVWSACSNPRALLTCPRAGADSGTIGLSVIAGFDPRRVPTLKANAIGVRSCRDERLQTLLVSADLLFGPIASFEDVPPDPHVHRRDESINLGLRLWTRGWDVFVPARSVLRSFVPSAKLSAKRSCKSIPGSMQEPELEASAMRWLTLLGGMLRGAYGLVRIRSLGDFQPTSGHDLERRQKDPPAEWSLFAQYPPGWWNCRT